MGSLGAPLKCTDTHEMGLSGPSLHTYFITYTDVCTVFRGRRLSPLEEHLHIWRHFWLAQLEGASPGIKQGAATPPPAPGSAPQPRMLPSPQTWTVQKIQPQYSSVIHRRAGLKLSITIQMSECRK